jgi:hypothetical protein
VQVAGSAADWDLAEARAEWGVAVEFLVDEGGMAVVCDTTTTIATPSEYAVGGGG